MMTEAFVASNYAFAVILLRHKSLCSMVCLSKFKYWVPLSAHTIMLGNVTTIRTLDRSIARGIGTIIGTIVLSGILAFHIDPIFAIIIMGFSAMMTEALWHLTMHLQSFYYDTSHYAQWSSLSKFKY